LHKGEIEFGSSYKDTGLCSGVTLCDSAHRFDFLWFLLETLLKCFYCTSQHLRSKSFPIRSSTLILTFEAAETEQLMASSYVHQSYWTELAILITVMNCRFRKRRGIFDRKSTTSFSRKPVPYEVSIYHALPRMSYLFRRKNKLIVQRQFECGWLYEDKMGLTCSSFGTKNAYHNSVERFLGKQPLNGLVS
jgi:hypothetical protein